MQKVTKEIRTVGMDISENAEQQAEMLTEKAGHHLFRLERSLPRDSYY